MIVCSCMVISDKDLERAVLEVMSAPNAPLPTPGVIYRHLQKQMQCCGCALLAADTIYAKMEDLERRGLICPCACASVRSKLDIANERRQRNAKPAVSSARRQQPTPRALRRKA